MRKVFVLLVAANVLAFAWWRGWFDSWFDTGREPQRFARQVMPEKVRVVPIERFEAARAARADCPPGAACGPAAPSQSTPSPEVPPQPQPQPQPHSPPPA